MWNHICPVELQQYACCARKKGTLLMKYAVLATLGLLTAAQPAFAHHPFDSEFDARAPMSLTGTVTKFDWVDPHVIVYVDVKDASGQTRNWHMETGSLAEMGKNGWTKATSRKATGSRYKGIGLNQSRISRPHGSSNFRVAKSCRQCPTMEARRNSTLRLPLIQG
jgi:Family of unknown function (DUF6152)